MAYTDGYDYDIFISYSHDDNDAPEGRTGWVTEFHDYLQNWLIKKRHLKGLKIWIDDALNGNTVFDQAIKDRISRSALFFVIHSYNYQDSDYCSQELNWFFEHNKKRPEGLRVGDESRLFNLLTNNIPYRQWPESLSEAGGATSGFVLHDAKGEGFGYPLPSDDNRFNQQMRQLVEAIARTLNSFPREVRKEAQENAQIAGISIFLADVPDTLSRFRKRLIAEIGDKATILDALPPPYPLVEHNQKLETVLDQANLTIHLMDQCPGRLVDDLQEQAYPRLQAEGAANHKNQSLIWVPDNLIAEEIEDEEQAAWLKRLEKGERKDSGNFQFIRSNQQALIDQVLQTIAGIQENVPTEESASFLIDTHQKDQLYAFRLAERLAEEGIGVEFNQESSDPVKSLGDFEKAVCHAQNLVIMFGKVNPKWLKERIKTTVKVIANQAITESTTLSKIWVLLLPGCPGQDAVPSIPLLRLGLLDNTSAKDITTNHLHELVSAGQGRANS